MQYLGQKLMELEKACMDFKEYFNFKISIGAT